MSNYVNNTNKLTPSKVVDASIVHTHTHPHTHTHTYIYIYIYVYHSY